MRSFRRNEVYQNETVEDFIRRWNSTEKELRETIAYLVEHREALRDADLEKLESESAKLLERLKNIETQKILVESQSFKEILSLHKSFIQKNDICESFWNIYEDLKTS